MLLLIMFLHFSSEFAIMVPYYRRTSTFTEAQLAWVLVPLNLFGFYLYWTYYLCVVSDAGTVPRGWSPEKDLERLGLTLTSKYRRYCQKCHGFKPPRAHHCKVCGRCILRMDHHCPWIANCVGHGNYGHFMRFVTGVSVSMLYHLGMISLRVKGWWAPEWYWQAPSNFEMVMIVLNYLLGIPVLVLVSFLMFYHFYLVAVNTTSIETWEQDRTRRLIRRGQIRAVSFPFNVSFLTNTKAVLGPYMALWCFPQRPVGTGLSYPVSVPDPAAQYMWPPKDPRTRTPRPRPRTAFTYGEEQLNPALGGGEQPHALRQRRSHDYHDDELPDQADSEQDARTSVPAAAQQLQAWNEEALYDSYESEEDEVNDTSMFDNDGAERSAFARVRRGSEGLEVIPPRYDRAFWYQLQALEPNAQHDMQNGAPEMQDGGRPEDYYQYHPYGGWQGPAYPENAPDAQEWTQEEEEEMYPYGSFVAYGKYAEDDT